MASYANVPPPPGPPPPPVAGASATPQARPPVSSPARRMVVQPPAITTSLHHNNNSAGTPYLQTPASTVSPPSALPFSPYAASSNPPSQPSTAPTSASRISSPMAFRGPSSAVVASYNPQEWGRHSSQVGGQFMAHAGPSNTALRGNTREATGMEGNYFHLFPCDLGVFPSFSRKDIQCLPGTVHLRANAVMHLFAVAVNQSL